MIAMNAEKRFRKLVLRGKAQGVRISILASPENTEADRYLTQNYSDVGDETSLTSQLDVIEGYLTGHRWIGGPTPPPLPTTLEEAALRQEIVFEKTPVCQWFNKRTRSVCGAPPEHQRHSSQPTHNCNKLACHEFVSVCDDCFRVDGTHDPDVEH